MFLGDGRGDGTNHHEKLGLKRISCASQFTNPDTAGTSPDPACNNTDMRSSQPNQASRTPAFSYPLVILHIVLSFILISNNSSFRQKHPGVPDGSDGSDGASYPLTENYTLPVAQATGQVA